jgi:hypothetical protein
VRGGCRKHHREAATDATIGQTVHAKQRRVGAQLDHHEGEEAGESGTADGERLRRSPAGFCCLRQGEDQRSEADRCQGGAAEVESSPARL